MLAWIAFAEDKPADALKHMREAADLQDKVGQGEVDIPAREMLADILLELGRPQDALAEYKKALALEPESLQWTCSMPAKPPKRRAMRRKRNSITPHCSKSPTTARSPRGPSSIMSKAWCHPRSSR